MVTVTIREERALILDIVIDRALLEHGPQCAGLR